LFPALSVAREYEAERINRVLNDPAVRPHVGLPDFGPLDFTQLVSDQRNALLMAGDEGGFFFQQLSPSLYEVHSQFLPVARGRKVVQAAIDAQRFMFCRTDCVEIVTKVPTGNVAATALVRVASMLPLFSHGGAAFYSKPLITWANEAQVSREAAEILNISDDTRVTALGLAIEMAAFGQIEKGLRFYDRFARLTNNLPMTLAATNPLVFDIGEALIALRDNSLEVILCRQRFQ
jgi:hypothetical protein